MEPSAQDIAAVSQAMGEQPQQQPPAPAPQPSPQSQPQTQPQHQQPQSPQPTQPPADPFSAFAQPTQPPVEPAQQPTQPTQPTEPAQPQAPPTQPQEQPTQPQTPPQQPDQLTVDQYMKEVFGDMPEIPGLPDASKVNPDSPESVQQYFDDLMTTAEKRFEAKYNRNQAVQNAEKKAWEDAFDKYGSLRSNGQLRDMVHAIRMNEFNRGVAITPTQAAERLLGALQQQYQRGVADNQVVTTIEQTQPVGGGSTSVPTTMDADKSLLAVQQGGEEALAQILDAQFKAQNQ